MPPATSFVWKYFKRCADDNKVKCSLCGNELSWTGGTSNMRNHIRLKHPVEDQTSLNSPTNLSNKQPSMTSFINTSTKLSAPQSEQITIAIADMIVTDYMPLSVVEGDGFLKLLNIVAPNYKVPCRNTLRARVIKRYDDEKECLIQQISNVSSASITTDTWTSNTTDSYITVTEHHITDDWEMKSNVLMTRAMPERHTGENLAIKLTNCVSEFGLDNKIGTCVHDNARNMECAGDKCTEWGDLGCFAHTLQLCIKPVLELPTVSKTVAKCRKLVGHFKHSTTLTAEMRKRQKMLSVPEHVLVQDVATRWNSTQTMMERLYEQRRVLTDIMLDSKFTKKTESVLLPKDHEWDVICDLSSVLKDLTQVTTYMCTEKDVSCSQIYPIVCGLIRNTLNVNVNDTPLIRKVKDTIASDLRRRYKPSEIETARTTPITASLLDPRYKRLPFLTSEQRKTAESHLESLLEDMPLKPRLLNENHTNPPASKRPRTELDFLIFDIPDIDDPSDEIQQYLSEKVSPAVNPLTWWKDNEVKYPKIALIAKKTLAVPATSVPSERVFSAAGLLVNKLRNRLSCDLVDKIIFLNKNMCQNVELESE